MSNMPSGAIVISDPRKTSRPHCPRSAWTGKTMPDVAATSGSILMVQRSASKEAEEADAGSSFHQKGTLDAWACLTTPRRSSPAISFVSGETPGYWESKQGERIGLSAEGPAKSRAKLEALMSTDIQRQRLTASGIVTVRCESGPTKRPPKSAWRSPKSDCATSATS